VVSQPHRTVFAVGDEEHQVDWLGGRHGCASTSPDVRVLSASPSEVVLEIDRISARFAVAIGPGDAVAVDGPMGSVQLRVVPRFVDPADVVAQGSLLAPMPGTVIGVPVEDGAEVTAGQPVLVLEAMKMQHTINAPSDGVVSDLVTVGQQVAAGEVLAVVSTGATDDESEENES
jgi:propionyl-CoA carboxylase alpha chain